jgi:nucleoid DNA-binding protein
MLFGKEKAMASIRAKLQCTWDDAEEVYEATVASIKEALDSGSKVRVPGIGILRKVDLKAGKAKNPATGADVLVGPRVKYALKSPPKAVNA